jgi:RNA polymerase sigma-70 factor, ECF subfamily
MNHFLRRAVGRLVNFSYPQVERNALTPFLLAVRWKRIASTMNQFQSEIPTASTTLLHQVRAMDSAGWSRLVEIFSPVVYTWSRRAGVRESETPDVVQEVFVTIAKNVSQFRRELEQGSFRSWLATITRTRIVDHFRKNRVQYAPTGGTDAMQLLEQLPSELETSITSHSAQSLMIQQAIRTIQAEFEERTWQAFWQTTVDGKSPSDVAKELDMGLTSVYQAKSRVLRRLRHHLSQIP